MQIERISFFINEQARRAGGAVRSSQSQPLLVRVIALLVIVLIAIPLAALIMATLLVAALALAIYLLARRVRNWFQTVLPRADGRENVRVIRTGEQRGV